MPIYEYVCKDCRKHFELLRPMKDADEPADCLACKSENVSRCITVFYAQSGGKVLAGGGGCAGCAGGNCAGCAN